MRCVTEKKTVEDINQQDMKFCLSQKKCEFNHGKNDIKLNFCEIRYKMR